MRKILVSLLFFLGTLQASSDGTTDTSFGTNGVTTIPILQSNEEPRLFIDTDQKIYATITSNSIARLTPDGILDTTFNPGGTTQGILPLASNISIFALLVQPDGKILIGGAQLNMLGNAEAFIQRFNNDGSADQTFNNGRPQTIAIGTFPLCASLALQSDLKIIASITLANNTITLARLTPEGQLDPSFNNTGIVQTTTTEQALIQGGVALTQTQKIVVCMVDEANSNLLIAQYNQDGSLDTTFNPTGPQKGIITLPTIAISTEGPSTGFPAIAIQPNGAILVGFTSFTPPSTFNGLQAVRLTPEGALDTTFNGTGFSQLAFLTPSSVCSIGNILVQPDGSILLVGTIVSTDFPIYDFGAIIVRYTPNGIIDTNFGTNGYAINPALVTVPPGTCGGAFQADGKIIVLTSTGGSPTDFAALVRFSNHHPLTSTTLSLNNSLLSGQAQSLGVVYAYQGSTLLCSSEVIGNTWSCTATIDPDVFTFSAVNQYPAGNVNLGTTCLVTLPQSALSTAIKNKYCPC